MRKLIGVLMGASLAVAVFAASAFASGAPTFDVTTLSPAIYSLGTVLLTGLAALIVVVLAVKGPFYLWNIAMRAIHKAFGRAKPQAG